MSIATGVGPEGDPWEDAAVAAHAEWVAESAQDKSGKMSAEQYGKVVEVTNRMQQVLLQSMLFDKVERIGMTTLHVNVWNYDPEAQAGFTIECKLGVSL